jgi:hypothetical protein
MTKEQLEKLNKLQAEIKEIRNAVDVLRSYKDYEIKCGRYDTYYRFPIEKVSALKEEIHSWLFDQFLGRSLELEEQLRELVICKEEKGETKYTPTDL